MAIIATISHLIWCELHTFSLTAHSLHLWQFDILLDDSLLLQFPNHQIHFANQKQNTEALMAEHKLVTQCDTGDVVLRTPTYVPPQEHTRENVHMQMKQENIFLREMLYEIL